MLLQSTLNINNTYNQTSVGLNKKQPYEHNHLQSRTYEWDQKIDRNKQLLLMMHKLMQVEESFWGKFFRFQKSQFFLKFQEKFSFKQIFRLRLDDIIYQILLITICITFALLPSSTTSSSIVGGLLVTAYRYLLTFLVLGTLIWLTSSNCFRHWVFLLLFGVFPLLFLLMYRGIIPSSDIDTSTNLFTYLHILSLWVVLIALYVVYPIKQFVRNKIGSMYSYLFALSTLTLFIIWPVYSLIEQLSINQSITFNFLTQNKALIITFLVIVVFTFHLFTHQTFFQGNLSQTRRLLLTEFTKPQLQQALQQYLLKPEPLSSITNDGKSSKNQFNSYSFLYRNYVAYSRIMSLIVFGFTIGIQIYIFQYLTNNLAQIFRSLGVMIFCVGFCVYGSIINLIPISRELTLYIFSLLSLIPMAFSPFYCNSCSNSTFSYYQYVFLATALPYTTIFWCIVRSLSRRKPFLRTNLLVIMYIFAHIPLTVFMLNNLEMLTSDASIINIINIITLGIVAAVTFIGLFWFIVWLCMSIKQLPVQKEENQKIVDYNYWEQGNPMYVPYKKKQSFSLSWLSSLDIRNLAELFNCIAFISCELATMYIFNQLITSYSSKTYIFETTPFIVYSQFFITFAYFTYAQSYIVFNYRSSFNYIVLFFLFVVGSTFIIISYVISISFSYVFRVGGGFSLAIFMLGIGLHIIKRNNKEIMNFLSGLITALIWIFLIIPYAIVLPIASIYIQSSQFGVFIYACILATALLVILLVSAISIVFNTLMNKFEEDKKAKFMTEDVQSFLKQEGVDTEDQILHVLFQSFENRDQKYVYFMRRGYPIRLFVDNSDNQTNYKTVVYNHEILNRKQSLKKIEEEEKSEDYCWLCLTCFCGTDQTELETKAAKISSQNITNQQQMQQLIPENLYKKLFVRALKQQPKQKKKTVDLSKLYSSKSIILKHLTQTSRHLGEEFAIIKTKKNKRLANQIWHIIFDFIANQDDYPPAKVIFNDFLIFCTVLDMPELTRNILNQIFLDFSATTWKNNIAIDINDFSVIIEELANRKYQSSSSTSTEDNKYLFLIEHAYPKLCDYSEFQDLMNERRVKTKKNKTDGSRMSERGSKNGTGVGFGQKYQANINLYSLTNQQHQNSPFLTSFQRYQKIRNDLELKRQKLNQKRIEAQMNRLIEPAIEQIVEKRKIEEEVIKQKSCKLKIYEKYQDCKNCCKRIEQQQTVIKRKNVKPWDYLSVQTIRILENKQKQWRQQRKQKQYEFRLIINNLLMALFKLADLYTFLEITIMNPVTGWQSARQFSILIIQYRVQLYISFALVLICGGLGIKGIQYIFQDRLGLTETRLPAGFPHPMFFFTFIYKLLILSFFNAITMTLLSTFMCDWTTSSSSLYSMIFDSTNQPLECFSSEHNLYMIFSLIALILYYPLSAYTMPNFQFSEKRLDLKYKPSYLIIFFQVNFVLSAGKVLLAQLVVTNSGTSTIEIIFQSINIFCLSLLCLMVIVLKPCLITWFNVVQFLVIWIGLIWNVMGLVLYLSGLWLLCVIVSSALSVASIIIGIIFIKRKYFGNVKISDEAQLEDIHELQLGWKYKKQYNIDLVRFKKQENKINNQKDKQVYIQKQSITQNDQKQFQFVEPNARKPKRNQINEDSKTHAGSNKNIPPAFELYGVSDEDN